VGDIANYVGKISKAVELAIAQLARDQWGCVTRAQLLAFGLSSSTIAYRVKTGRLFPVHPGVYAVGRPLLTPIEKAAAAVLACGSEAGLACGSAMTLWGFWKRWDTPFEVAVFTDRRPRGIKVRQFSTLTREDMTTQQGIRTTTPARTIWDIAPRLTDKQLKRTVNQALHSPFLSKRALTPLLDRPHPTAKRLRPLILTPDGPTRSGWEDEFADFAVESGLPPPLTAAPVGPYTVDVLFVKEQVIVELDSYDFHSGPIAFEEDRNRDADTASWGYVTVRVTWTRRYKTPKKEMARLKRTLDLRRAELA
jgi:hypothetical protein